MSEADLAAIGGEPLAGWIAGRRWFGSKSRRIDEARVLDAPLFHPGPPRLGVALVELGFEHGPDETYQLPFSLADDETFHDLLGDRDGLRRLMRRIAAGDGAEDGDGSGSLRFEWTGAAEIPAGAEPRPVSTEQSNSSAIYGENAILKLYRRLERGQNPELELLRFLGSRGFRHTPALLGWFEYRGDGFEATLGIAQEFVADGRDGWAMTLDGLAGDGERPLAVLGDLGATLGEMHLTLASDPDDPAFAAEPRGAGWLTHFAAELESEVERVFAGLPDNERLAPVAGRGGELREQVGALAGGDDAGRAIRVHGDLHLGQTLHSDAGWTILDFEGEPARSLPERRAKHSPLRDVAGMLRSLAYAPLAARLQRGAEPPPAWEGRARQSLLDGYLGTVDPALLPADRAATERLLALYELEKAVYELRYEIDNRPDWVEIPVAGLTRLLEVPSR